MKSQRWLRIIPVALIMYTISYVDRTNVSMALTPKISSLMKDLLMDDKMKGEAAGIFFIGYVLLQVPGGYIATRWSARKLISISLVVWGLCAVGCGLVQTYQQFAVARFFLGVAESAVFPAMMVLLASWFPRAERARANAYWNLCQPLGVMVTALLTGALLDSYGWRKVLVIEGALPFVWLPVWWFFIRDRPAEADWISREEKEHLETTLRQEVAAQELVAPRPLWEMFYRPLVILMIGISFLHNCLAYGCMAFFTSSLEGRGFSALQNGMLFALPYTLTMVLMIVVSRHSDRTNERRYHVALTYSIGGSCLILSVLFRGQFWLSYLFLCLSIPTPSVALAPLWAVPSENLPGNARGAIMGLINACGNLGGFVGPSIVGWLKQESGSLSLPFVVLGVGTLIAGGLCCLLPKTAPRLSTLSNIPQPANRIA
jgi:MFS family permease